ncbi:MAG: T9SS type A sorting domain-containing protein [Bacteroidota bacterium]|nr:MAG: T9SS type A sorting domain-containing protein [Bacteroidota bacterium]
MKHFAVIISFLSILCITTQNQLLGQVSHGGHPFYKPIADTLFVPVLEISVQALPISEKKKALEVDFKTDQFAATVDVSVNTEDFGVWIDFAEQNKRVWLLKIKAENARSYNFLFSQYELIPGCRLFIYNASQSKILGAFTHLNNKPWKSLSTTLIEASEVYLELQVPLYANKFGLFELGRIGVEPQTDIVPKSTSDQWFGRSADCHLNVNCETGFAIQLQKRAVCRIIYQGSRRCTGTLLNNLDRDETPYVLTAAHCFSSEYTANNAVFDFNYESPTCENEDVPLQSVSGASIVSAGFYGVFPDSLDFLLLRLSEKLPPDYKVYYSGWDARGVASTGNFVLHHPQGDIKKVSIDEDAIVTSTFTGFNPAAHWLVNDYEKGSSENGSSGAGLISSELLLIGTLTGGGETCSDPITDYYQKFSRAYNDYAPAHAQLKAWLDPKNLNVLTCVGYDPSSKFRETAEIITNILPHDSTELVLQELGWGYVSGHNYLLDSIFAERFAINGSKYLYGANIQLAKVYSSDTTQKVMFTLWQDNLNPGSILYEKAILIADLEALDTLFLDFDSTILVKNTFYFGYRIAYEADTFAVKVVPALNENNSAFTYFDGNWQMLQRDGQAYPAKLAIEMLAFDFLPVKGVLPDTSFTSPILLYPNPSSQQLQILFKTEVSGKVSVRIHDIGGRPVYHQDWYNPEPNIPVEHNLPAGVYVLSVIQDNKQLAVQKLLVQ